MNPEPKYAVIMGGAMGIGAAIAKQFVADGYHVTIIDRIAAKAHQTAEELSTPDRPVHAEVADITRQDQVREAVANAKNRAGAHGILAAVNSAGVFDERRPALQTDMDAYRRVMDINVAGALIFSQAVVPHMASQGSMVHIGSVNGKLAGDTLGVYKASKAALHMLCKCIALELAREPRRIRCNVVAPGWVDTPGERKVVTAAGRPEVLDDPESARFIPLERRIGANEIADAVAFLCSARASAITGQILYVDGGTTTFCGLPPISDQKPQ